MTTIDTNNVTCDVCKLKKSRYATRQFKNDKHVCKDCGISLKRKWKKEGKLANSEKPSTITATSEKSLQCVCCGNDIDGDDTMFCEACKKDIEQYANEYSDNDGDTFAF